MRILSALCGLAVIGLSAGCHSTKAAEPASLQAPVPASPLSKTLTLTPDQMSSPLLQLVTVKKEVLSQTVEVLGAIASDTDQVTQVHPAIPGRAKDILVAAGDNVKAGQVLMRYTSGLHSADSRDLAAPKGGVLLGLYADRGDHVEPAIPVATIADTSRLRCILDVFEKDIGKIAKGQKATIRVTAFPGQTFPGEVTYISPRVDEDTRTIKIRVDVANPEGKLKFGMFVNGSIVVDQHAGLSVPQTAIQTIDGKDCVLILQGQNTVTIRSIVLGEKLDGKVEVTSGLSEGETVIGQGSFILKNEFNKTGGDDEG